MLKQERDLLLSRLESMAEEMEPGSFSVEQLYDLASEHMPYLRRYARADAIRMLRRTLLEYGPHVGIMRTKRGLYTVGKVARSDGMEWQMIMSAEWLPVSELLPLARARGFDLPDGEHAARIAVGRAIRKLPWTIMRRRDGYTLYSTTAGPYGDRD